MFDFVWNSFCISNHHHHHHHYQTRKLRGRDDLSILIVRDTFSSNKETKRKIWFVDFVCLKYFLIFHHQTGKKGVKMILSNLFVWNTFWYFIIKLGEKRLRWFCLICLFEKLSVSSSSKKRAKRLVDFFIKYLLIFHHQIC